MFVLFHIISIGTSSSHRLQEWKMLRKCKQTVKQAHKSTSWLYFWTIYLFIMSFCNNFLSCTRSLCLLSKTRNFTIFFSLFHFLSFLFAARIKTNFFLSFSKSKAKTNEQATTKSKKYPLSPNESAFPNHSREQGAHVPKPTSLSSSSSCSRFA